MYWSAWDEDGVTAVPTFIGENFFWFWDFQRWTWLSIKNLVYMFSSSSNKGLLAVPVLMFPKIVGS